MNRVGVKTGVQVDGMRVVEEGLTGKEWVVTKGTQKAIPGKGVIPDKQASGAKVSP